MTGVYIHLAPSEKMEDQCGPQSCRFLPFTLFQIVLLAREGLRDLLLKDWYLELKLLASESCSMGKYRSEVVENWTEYLAKAWARAAPALGERYVR